MLYHRDLPGEIMFFDAVDVAESLSWERDLLSLAGGLRSLGPESGRPAPACWVIATQALFLVAGSLAAFASTARRYELTVIDRYGGGLTLQDEAQSRRTVVRPLDRDPPHDASPRWWREQEDEWVGWDKARKRRRSGRRTFTPLARWPWSGWPVTEDHLADVDAVIAYLRASGRPVTVAEVSGIFDIGPSLAKRLLRERGIRIDDEAVNVVRRLAAAGNGPVLARDVAAYGIPQSRAAMAVRRHYGADLSKLLPDMQGRVTGPQVAEAYRLSREFVSRRVRSGGLEVVGKLGAANLFAYEQVRAVLG